MSKFFSFTTKFFLTLFFVCTLTLFSPQLQATAVLPAPTLKSAIGGIGKVTLAWDKVPDATSYTIKYGTTSNMIDSTVTGDVNTFAVSGLANSTIYYFVVVAKNATSTSAYSRQMSARTQLPPPFLSGASGGIGKVVLTWEKVPGATSYIVKYGTTSLNYPTVLSVADVNTFTVTGLANDTSYYFVVAAKNSLSTSINSRQMTGKTWGPTAALPKPTVNFSANPTAIKSGESTKLTWTSTNATSLYIDNAIGAASDHGTLSVFPKVTTTYTITATGALGSANAKVTVYVTATPTAQPQGTFGSQYKDIIPQDATVKEYAVKRFAIIRGEVKDKNNLPLSQVSVFIDGHPEYGTTKTDTSGQFSLPVDLNGTLNISFEKQGFIPSHRQIYVAPNDVAIVETLTLLSEDTKATEVALNGDAKNIVVHQSTPVSDVSGTRSANVVITGDNKAYAVDEHGKDMFELSKLNVRATEFATPASMPAALPPTSAFTYCVELKADGVDRVRFKDPVVVYVDNFLGFNVGEIVPVGYYDRDRGVWVASENGRVVKLLDTNGDTKVDALDSTGDGVADDLNKNGDYSDEVKGLNDPAKYTPGKTFWRVSLTHFTPWDFNWPFWPEKSAIGPNAKGKPNADQQKNEGDDCDKATNSFVNCRSRIYHEDIDIPGTDLTLHYASNRVPAYKTVITVPASGDTVPSSLQKIVVRLDIAGRTFEQTLPTLANQTAEFRWDGLDYFGHRVDSTTAHITTEFVYKAFYVGFGATGERAPAFGEPGVTTTTVRAREEFIFSTERSILVHNQAETRERLAQGWTLSNHHFMSARDVSTLYKGNGDVVSNDGLNIITTIAGTGEAGYSGDGGPATEAKLYSPVDVAVDQSGNIYIADYVNHRIRKIDLNGIITTIAGTGVEGYSGDGGPATAAGMYPSGLAVDLNGNVYITDNQRIRKIDTNGIITTIAGTGVYGFSGDGGPATLATFKSPTGITVDAIGNIYISDTRNQRVRKINTDGIISTIATTPSKYNKSYPTMITSDQKGNIYFTVYGSTVLGIPVYCEIYKIDINGVNTLVAGDYVSGFSGDGGPAKSALLQNPNGIAVDKFGNIYFADTGNLRTRKIDIDGIITTVAGTGERGYSGDGGSATAAKINRPYGVAVDQGGNIYIADSGNNRIRKITLATAFAPADPGDMTFAEEGFGYTFSLDGKHKQTVDLDTKKILEQFGYDPSGRLISSTDSFDNKVTIERNASGVPTAIVSPDGVRTNLTIDAKNHLTQITYPDGKSYNFEYTPGGLLTKETEPKGNFFTHTFDANGRITDVLDQEGGHEKFGRKVDVNTGDVTTTVTSGEGDVVTYVDQTASTGALTSTSSVSGVTKPTTFSRSSDELTSKITSPDLTVSDLSFDLDPEYKFKYLKSQTITTPSGLKAQATFARTYIDTNSDGKKDLITRSASLNSKSTTLTHDVLTSTFKATSPLGRSMTTVYDPTTLLTSKVSVPELFDTTYTYDLKGRVKTVQTSTRTMSLDYDLNGNVESITDPRGNRTSYTYDAVGRTTKVHRPDSTEVHFEYDANGNMTVLTNPSSQNHGYIYNAVNLPTSYAPPISPATQYVYDKERRLKEIDFPSGKKIKNVYTGVLLTQTQTPEGNVDYTYLPSGQLAKVTKGSESLNLSYDGSLLKTVTSAGTLGQTLSLTYNTDFKVTGLTYAGAINSFGYDNDGLLTSSGRFTIGRNAQNGLPTAVAGGVLNLTRTFNGFAELSTQTQTVNGSAAALFGLTYNPNGQIATKSETVAGVTSNYAYTYDALGRLTKVEKDGVLVEEYGYAGADPLGTRTYEMNTLRGIAGRSLTYNAEDQLLSVGSATYQYDTDGFLSKKTDGAAITTYNYSSAGELLSASLPDGRTLEYVYDPQGRRIAKKINGVLVEKYLWAGLTQLLAVYDGADSLVMRFEYSDARVPNAMVKSGTTYYLSYDQVGSLRAVYDATGALVKRIDYDSFGNILVDTNPAFSLPFGFAGGLDDRDTNLVHFGFRDYDPLTGRWTAKDPIGFGGGDVDLYGYVESDPINFVDPYGLYWLKDWSDFFGGFGDFITFGGTGWLRDQWGYGGFVDPCSGWYTGGEIAGFGASVALGAAWGLEAAGTKGAGKEFSHWIPKRLGGPNSLLNGNYVSKSTHALSDPYRYRFMSKAWKASNPIYNPLQRQWIRLPNWIKGAGAGAGYGTGSNAIREK